MGGRSNLLFITRVMVAFSQDNSSVLSTNYWIPFSPTQYWTEQGVSTGDFSQFDGTWQQAEETTDSRSKTCIHGRKNVSTSISNASNFKIKIAANFEFSFGVFGGKSIEILQGKLY